MSRNRVCLADGYVFPVAQEETGINENRIIVGPTRGGKTFSIVEPLLLHTYEGSLVVTITKRALFDKYSKLFEARGYKVLDLNFANPEESKVGFDPFDYLKEPRHIKNLGRAMAENVGLSNSETYWVEATASAMTALIDLAVLNAEFDGSVARLRDLESLLSYLQVTYKKMVETNLDIFFKKADRLYPGNMASQKWKTLSMNSSRTAACISSMLNMAADDLLSPDIIKLSQFDTRVNFENMAKEKTVLFVTTSPVNKSTQQITNIFYQSLFSTLFEYAEKLESKELPIPVHVICDDFATGGIIPDFAEYISVICAKKISATLLLQSESQLAAMYSDEEATTIINNCDTYVYLGGMDDMTCQHISKRVNLPVDEIYALPLEQVIVFRRGSKPIMARRYQTLEDQEYKELMAM